jgi:hypothetical protein
MARTVLITGGAGGIGRATGERFAAAGDTVAYAAGPCGSLAGSDTIVVTYGRRDCERMIAETVERHGRLDAPSTAPALRGRPQMTGGVGSHDRREPKGTFFACRFAMHQSGPRAAS